MENGLKMQPHKPECQPQNHARCNEILRVLTEIYPLPRPQLKVANPWELMVATILAAQCTDARVNKVTPELFSRWPGPEAMARADITEVEAVIRSTGLFHSKARNLLANARRLVEHYNSQVPSTMKDLTSLAGVARKTANIVLWGSFGKNEGVAVDTHVGRISRRLGLTASDNPLIVEKDLMRLFPPDSWGDLNNRLVLFGRDICQARTPQCPGCPLFALCPKTGLDAAFKPLPKSKQRKGIEAQPA